MYTSIPIEDSISNIENLINLHHEISFGLHSQDIMKLLQVTLTNTYFTFNNKFYKQIDGLPMGSSLSGLLAITFIDTLQRQVLSNVTGISILKRYVDDCFILAENREKAFLLLDQLNIKTLNSKSKCQKAIIARFQGKN